MDMFWLEYYLTKGGVQAFISNKEGLILHSNKGSQYYKRLLWASIQNLVERKVVLAAFEVVQTILGFGSFTIALIGYATNSLKMTTKIIRPHFWRSKTDYFRLKLATVF